MASEQRAAMRGGKGTVTITHLFKPGEMTTPTRLCAKLTLPPGASIGLHPHEREDEVYYILRGTGRILDNGALADVGPGDAILTGGGASHAIECTSAVPLEIMAVIISAPAQ